MGFKKRRDKRPEAGKNAPEFEHSSGASNLEKLLGEHTLDDDAEPVVPKGYRARSIAKSENRR